MNGWMDGRVSEGEQQAPDQTGQGSLIADPCLMRTSRPSAPNLHSARSALCTLHSVPRSLCPARAASWLSPSLLGCLLSVSRGR